ncbi:O-antigen ligase family protein [Caulobacter sp. KR2-114]|uniref:O-antigen ligase family protein n=1 Tax=Caulobacter sp. KR2-114 TaxID=3400912 RepID=UPI003C097B97
MGASTTGEILLHAVASRPAAHARETAPWQPAAALLAVCLVFGGSSQGNALPTAITELAGLAGLTYAAWRWRSVGFPPHARLGGAFLLALAAFHLIQLAPLPPGLWALLPGRGALAGDLRLAGTADAWRPLSLTPQLTWRSLLGLLAPAAMFLLSADLSAGGLRRLAGLMLAVALASVMLATLQLAGGPYSPLRFYAITNADSGVGFFANRNHLASLLVVSMPLAAALAVDWGLEGRRGSTVRVAATLGIYLVLMVGVGVSLSRAGMLLLAPAVLASLAIALVGRGPYRQRPAALLLVGASVIGLFLVGAFSLAAVAQRFHQEGATDIRFQAAPVVIQMAKAYGPVGTGFGAFESAYGAAEPVTLLLPNYLNHAHDDYLELWLEGGVLGVALALGFIAWWVRASVAAWWAVWRRTAGSMLPAAASAGAGLLLLHSAADYPLRTTALACVLALFCGTLSQIRATAPQ